MVLLLSAQGMDAAAIAKVAFTSEDWIRDVIHNFNADGFDSLYPRPASEECSPRAMSGNATVTIVTSTSSMNVPAQTATSGSNLRVLMIASRGVKKIRCH
jgi:Winged helix-turn helix